MRKTDRIAFIALALHCCGFIVSYELMIAWPVPGGSLSAIAGAHLACILLAALALPALVRNGRVGRVAVCLVLLSAFATRLPGVEGWKDSVPFRLVMQLGPGTLAAAVHYIFFSLTPRECWVRGYALAWLAGLVGKECILAATLAGGTAQSALYIGSSAAYSLAAVVACVCVFYGHFSQTAPRLAASRSGKYAFIVLAANVVLVATFLGVLSGWVGPFHTQWADTNPYAPRIAMPLTLVLVGWWLRRNFKTGFRDITALCAILCFAIATLSVLRREELTVMSIPFLSICCQTAFYNCMTQALVRVTHSPRLFCLATVIPYAAMIFAGTVTYRAVPLQEFDFTVVVALCFIVFMIFYVCTRNLDFSLFSAPHPFNDEPGGLAEQISLEQLADHFQFSPREREVAALITQGMGSTAIATAMHRSRFTINSHVRNMCEKAGVNSREELVKLFSKCRAR